MIRTMHTTDPALPSVTVIAVDYQDYLLIWNASNLDTEGAATRDDLINEAMCQAQRLSPPPTGEVVDFNELAERVRAVRASKVVALTVPPRQAHTVNNK